MSKKILGALALTLASAMMASSAMACTIYGIGKNATADGSTIVFDSDFYGNHRGARVLPGPFATLDASMQPLF